MQNSIIKQYLTRRSLFVIITMLFTIFSAHTKESAHSNTDKITVLPEYIFSPTDNLSDQVEQTLLAAKTQNKQALFVLGAQWCHDSRGLSEKFSTPGMQKILVDNYQVLFIDVGYLEKGFDVVNQFDLPVYYGTPTVMVVDPNSTKILNRSSMQKWLSADSVHLMEYEEYFESFASSSKELVETNPAMQIYLDEINKFEQHQALRLKEAYGIIGPLLQQYKEGDNKKPSEEFSNKWGQVRELRYRIQNDIQALITQAKSNVTAGSSAPLTLPIYPAFTWE